jgi:hypothetical protein
MVLKIWFLMLLLLAAEILLLFKRRSIAKRRANGWAIWQKKWSLCIKTKRGIWWSSQRGKGRYDANGCSRKRKQYQKKGEKSSRLA